MIRDIFRELTALIALALFVGGGFTLALGLTDRTPVAQPVMTAEAR